MSYNQARTSEADKAYRDETATPGYRVPEELGGLPFTQCVHQLAAAIHRYGSPALRADLDELEEMVTGLVGQELTALIGQVED